MEGRKGRECWNEKKLELRLGPPGEEENWSVEGNRQMDHESLLSLGPLKTNSFWTQTHHQHPNLSLSSSSFLHFSSITAEESCGTKVLDFQNPEKKAPANPSSSQKRTVPVVGWPPIRSSRRNLASGSASKQAAESPNPNAELHKGGGGGADKTSVEAAVSGNGKGLFVKINMDGVPIGRKVDLKAYDTYSKLSTAVDELFTGLVAVQADSCSGETANKKEITGILDGNGEYTLVYEDNEGDRMLVGDVPWHMFVSTVKRLRVLKSSDVSALSLTSGKQRQPTDLSLP